MKRGKVVSVELLEIMEQYQLYLRPFVLSDWENELRWVCGEIKSIGMTLEMDDGPIIYANGQEQAGKTPEDAILKMTEVIDRRNGNLEDEEEDPEGEEWKNGGQR